MDEVDNLLIEGASSSVNLSGPVAGMVHLQPLLLDIYSVVQDVAALTWRSEGGAATEDGRKGKFFYVPPSERDPGDRKQLKSGSQHPDPSMLLTRFNGGKYRNVHDFIVQTVEL